MNDKNKIDLSIEMYEDLKETLVKAIKNAKAGGEYAAGTDRTADRGRGTLARADRTAARTTATEYGLVRSKNRADAGIYRQIQRVAGAVSGETGGDRQGEPNNNY